MKLLILTLLNIAYVFGDAFSPTVTIPLGRIEGFVGETVSNKKYFAFEGIPYARPPVGKLRFKEPVIPKPWEGIWKAKTMYRCMQYDHFTPPGQDMVSGDEDCLYVNVYTPNLNPDKKFDVLVYIHGGAFMFNYGGLQGPQILLDRNIVYVSLNYRLGPLGFLSTEDDVVPGNNGLKDQLMALQWVKDNIKYFGGDPDSITISGMSAGGASVELHYLLEKSKGLFHKGISQSGTVFNCWVLVENPLEKSKKLSDIVGCPTRHTDQMVSCLRDRPARQITHTVKHFQPWLYNPFTPFGPVVDSWASNPLLPKHPFRMLAAKQVQDLPWITSHVSSEGLYPASDFYRNDYLKYINDNWYDVMPFILHYNESVEPDHRDFISQQIRRHYFANKEVNKESFSTLVELLGDRLFLYDIEKASRLHAAAIQSPVYAYSFSYRGAHSKSEFRTGTDKDLGVSHGDDTSYIFKTNLDTLATESDKQMSKIMVDMFTSFMETGKPNVTSPWKPLSKKMSDPWIELHIKSPSDLFLEVHDQIGNRKFWDNLPFKENDNLYIPRDEL